MKDVAFPDPDFLSFLCCISQMDTHIKESFEDLCVKKPAVKKNS